MGLFFDASPELQNVIGLLGSAIQDYGARRAGKPANAFEAYQQKIDQGTAHGATSPSMGGQMPQRTVPPAGAPLIDRDLTWTPGADATRQLLLWSRLRQSLDEARARQGLPRVGDYWSV